MRSVPTCHKMSASVDQYAFKKLSLRRFPKLDQRESSETKFWKKFQFPVTVKENAAISSIHFSPSSPFDFAVTSGPRVQVYSATTNQLKKSISRFHQSAYSGCFRHDGQLLAAGSEEGVVKVFNVQSRAVLRQCKGHSKACKAVSFSTDGHKLFSGSDDTTVRCWDLATQECFLTLQGHEDYIRRVCPNPSSTDLLLTASYDHTLRLWDTRRSGSAVLELQHQAPVEDLLFFPSGAMCVSCGNNWVRVWDLLAGGKLLLSFSNHQKTITSLCFDGTSQRLLSAGLDRQVKVYSLEDYRVLHSMSYPAPILSMAMSPTDSHIVAGMTSKLLSIKSCPLKREIEERSLSAIPPRTGSYRYFMRGKSYQPTEEYVVTVPRMSRLQPYEKFLKSFKYKKALIAAVEYQGTGKALVVYSLLQELARREGLNTALSGLTEDELYPILTYISRNLAQPRFTSLLIDVTNIIADIYGCMLSESKSTMALFRVVKVKVDREIQFQKHAFQLLGSINTLLAAAVAGSVHHS